jgi:hypothetical protein
MDKFQRKYLIKSRQLHSTSRQQQSTNTEANSEKELLRPLQNPKFYRRVYRPRDNLSHLNPLHSSYLTHYPPTYAYVLHGTPSLQISSLRLRRYLSVV